VDAHTFDRLIQRLAGARSRRSLVGGSLGAAVLMALRWGQEAGAKKRAVTAEDKLGIGARCDPSNKEHGKKHGCRKCRTGYSVKTTNGKGKTIRKCACKPVGEPSSRDKQWQCCSGVSDGSRCISPAGGAVCPPTCPICQTCTAATGQCQVDTTQNGRAGTACPTPNACCTGTCCTGQGEAQGVRACNAAGRCATCDEVCPDTCLYCFNLADGGTVCGNGSSNPCVPCSSADDCTDPDFPYCVESFTIRAFNERRVQCDIGTACTGITRCT
jgi:hypothetical protein